MKTEGFVKLLRKIIREEVRNVVKTELKPLLNEVRHNKQDINLKNVAPKSKPVTKSNTNKQFVKDPVLNEMLNETASNPLAMTEEWPSMDFKADMAEAFSGGQQSLTTTGINGERVDMSNEKVATAVGNMTKDYSALMKAIDKKKGIR